jgi:hypothetical protein
VRVVALSGLKRSGKDTVAAYLVKEYGFTRVAFADPVREHIYTLNPWLLLQDDQAMRLQDYVDLVGWEGAKEHPEVRRLLQIYATEVVRDGIDPRTWLTLGMRSIRSTRGPVVVTDMRFKNELFALRNMGAKTVRVTRNAAGVADAHRSENELANASFQYELDNNGTIDQLHQKVDRMMKEFVK